MKNSTDVSKSNNHRILEVVSTEYVVHHRRGVTLRNQKHRIIFLSVRSW